MTYRSYMPTQDLGTYPFSWIHFRFFEYAKLADEKAKTNPEYQEEYEGIARNCRKLSADLLSQCNKTSEIKQLLDEISGSSNYFRDYKEMKHPRLRLALEQNHRDFVGHIFRQTSFH